MVQETEKQPEKATRARKPVQGEQGQVLKAVRCHYTDVSRKGALQIIMQRIL